MTAFPEDLFTQIYRRALTAEDRTRLLAIKAGLGLSPRDEMWPVILVLDHYDTSIRAGRSATVKAQLARSCESGQIVEHL